ncbi:MAG: hypothetical protein QE271_06250 [Bacteriovoracaceae bacterium]|nr:hypothetical protein [Bacteriovoracaceae bacterium]
MFQIISKNMVNLFLGAILFTYSLYSSAQDSCSRIATVNYQDIFIDSSSSKKGEGLRNYLSQNAESLSLLNTYQENTVPNYWISGASTAGLLMVILGMASSRDSGTYYSKQTLMSTGLVVIAVSLITSQALKAKNEDRLMKSIDIYNSNNDPKILLPQERSKPIFDFSFFTKEF